MLSSHGKSEKQDTYLLRFVVIEFHTPISPGIPCQIPPNIVDFSNIYGTKPLSLHIFADIIPECPPPIIQASILSDYNSIFLK